MTIIALKQITPLLGGSSGPMQGGALCEADGMISSQETHRNIIGYFQLQTKFVLNSDGS